MTASHQSQRWALSPPQSPGAPYPRFPVEFHGFPDLHAPFLNERRTRGPVESCVQEIRGISPVFGEMWDTADLPFKPVARSQIHRGAPGSHQRTWAENDGRPQISYFALLARATCAALLKESRMRSINATGLHRKSGGKPHSRLVAFRSKPRER